jgi:hypothetical protein
MSNGTIEISLANSVLDFLKKECEKRRGDFQRHIVVALGNVGHSLLTKVDVYSVLNDPLMKIIETDGKGDNDDDDDKVSLIYFEEKFLYFIIRFFTFLLLFYFFFYFFIFLLFYFFYTFFYFFFTFFTIFYFLLFFYFVLKYLIITINTFLSQKAQGPRSLKLCAETWKAIGEIWPVDDLFVVNHLRYSRFWDAVLTKYGNSVWIVQQAILETLSKILDIFIQIETNHMEPSLPISLLVDVFCSICDPNSIDKYDAIANLSGKVLSGIVRLVKRRGSEEEKGRIEVHLSITPSGGTRMKSVLSRIERND